MTASFVRDLEVVAVSDERVTCGGVHPTAPVKPGVISGATAGTLGSHALLTPVFLLSELTLGARAPKAGDLIRVMSEPPHEHVSRP